MNKAIARAVQILGNGAKSTIARAAGVTPQAVGQLAQRDVPLPAEYVLPIVRLTAGQMTPYELRPDLYPDPNWLPPMDAPTERAAS